MAYDDANERHFANFPKHCITFSGWTVPIDLRGGTGITGHGGSLPAKPATTIIVGNNSQNASETGQVTVATVGGQTAQPIIVPPLCMSPPLHGHFTHLLARGGTGVTGMYVIAFWAD